jgi:hypothetical protein
MENILFALFSAILLIISTLIIATTSIRSVNVISDSFKVMEQQSIEIRNTSIDLQFIEYSNQLITLKIANIGQTDLGLFDQWDILVQRSDGQTSEIGYIDADQPASNQWSIRGIYLAAGGSEVFDPGILNPDEVMSIWVNVDPPLNSGEVVRITAVTPNGVRAQCIVSI